MSFKGQTTIILIILVIIIFAGIGLFLFSFAKVVSKVEYMNIYTNNLLLSIMRTDTGYTDASCKRVSDVIACAFLTPEWRCGGTGPRCLDVANATVTQYTEQFDMVRKNFRYLFTVEPVGFTVGEPGHPFTVSIGDEGLETEKIEKITATEPIVKIHEGRQYLFTARIVIAKK